MIRKMLAALTVLAVAGSALAGESANWQSESTAAKVLDFVYHSDGNVYAATHDSHIYQRASATKSWAEVGNISAGLGGACARARWGRYPLLDSSLNPKIISFQNKIYVATGYIIRYCVPPGGGSHNHYEWPELAIYQIDPAGASTVVLQVRGAKATTKWISGNNWNFSPSQRDFAFVDGYLFKDQDLDGPLGAKIFWGGGGSGNPLTGAAVETGIPAGSGELDVAAFTRGTYSSTKYVYESANGTDWSLVDGGNGRRGTDQYGRSFGMAMPNGYRYSHLIEFDGRLWDYYGYYDVAPPFAYTRHISDGNRDVLTEPWSRFQMGAGLVDGANRLFRVGFSPRGDKNYIYSTTSAGANWSKYTVGAGNPNTGAVYWRGFAVINCTDDVATATVDESRHSGLYATYSQKTGVGAFESGIWRYSDWNGSGMPSWHKIRSTADARVYTGAIFARNNDGVYVGTTGGILRRGMGSYNDGGTPADPADDENPAPDV